MSGTVPSHELAKAAPPSRAIEGLPEGAEVRELRGHGDERGMFTELFRREWELALDPPQWNAVRSEAGVLRGVHVHLVHDDYLTVVAGRAVIGLRDLRAATSTPDAVSAVVLDASEPGAIRIPHGVAHGFLFEEPSVHVYAVSEYWNPADELVCRWDDPDLAIPWPARPRLLSPQDSAAPSLRELLAGLEDKAAEALAPAPR